MLLLTLDPSPSDILIHLNPLLQRLNDLETSLRSRCQWHPPPHPPKSPEYSIIDIADLSSAISLLEDIARHSSSQPISPQPAFSKFEWIWDPAWKEFYASTEEGQIYLSRWNLDGGEGVWRHASSSNANGFGAGVGIGGPDEAAELLGSWEDWEWDALWKEWYLNVSDEGQCRVYASKWELRANGQWVYVGRMGGS
ncbi:hypothetical protein DE146DRAFT_612937 [Phaeosphaeria sp. MPI-PUGE-AT-0046c]|nr:hypothetical protein DE146DRAFT_612937 [Phaeosphaeria sp. MPI-PUGE-AT-0046c]